MMGCIYLYLEIYYEQIKICRFIDIIPFGFLANFCMFYTGLFVSMKTPVTLLALVSRRERMTVSLYLCMIS